MKANKFLEKAKTKKVLETTSSGNENVPAVVEKELEKITREIKADLQKLDAIVDWVKEKKKQFNDTRERIVQNLIYVREHKKRLLKGRTFTEYLEGEVGISKGYFYEVLRAFELAQEYKKPELFQNVDYRILADIARIDDVKTRESLLKRADTLTREDVKKSAGQTFSEPIEASFTVENMAEVNNTSLTIKLPNADILKEIESLLKERGIEIKYT